MAEIFTALFRQTIAAAEAHRQGLPEYIGTDNLRHCGICHEPIEAMTDDVPGFQTLPRLCACVQRRMAPAARNRENAPISGPPILETEEETVARMLKEAREARQLQQNGGDK